MTTIRNAPRAIGLADLSRKLRSAPCGEEINIAIALALDGFVVLPPRYEGDEIGYGYINEEGTRIYPGYGGTQLIRDYSGCFEFAMRLAKKLLPDWQLEQLTWEGVPNGRVVASIGNFGRGNEYRSGIGDLCASPGLAIIDAVVRAALDADAKLNIPEVEWE